MTLLAPKTIQNAANIELSSKAGFVPQMGGAMQGYFQPMTFIQVDKGNSGGMLVESGDSLQPWTAPDGSIISGNLVEFNGVLFPKSRMLTMKDIGQRMWAGWDLFANPQLQLKTDDCVIYNGVTNIQYRVMAKWDYALYQFVQYFLIQDYTFSGPLVAGEPT